MAWPRLSVCLRSVCVCAPTASFGKGPLAGPALEGVALPAPHLAALDSTTDAAATAPTAAPPFFISERASRDPALLLFHKYRDVLSVLDPSDLLANLRLPRRHRGALRCLGCGACAALTRRQAPDNTGRNNNARAGRVSYLRGGAVSKEGHFCAHKFTAFIAINWFC